MTLLWVGVEPFMPLHKTTGSLLLNSTTTAGRFCIRYIGTTHKSRRLELPHPANKRNNSASGMKEYSTHLGINPCFGPFGMLTTQSCGFHLARRPVELLGQPQPALACHAAKNRELLKARLFIR